MHLPIQRRHGASSAPLPSKYGVTMVAMARRGGGVGETQQGEEDLETTTAHLFDSYAGQRTQK